MNSEILVEFYRLMERDHGLNWKLAYPFEIIVLPNRPSDEDKIRVKVSPIHFMDINLPFNGSRYAKIGVYKNAKTMQAAVRNRFHIFDAVYKWTVAVGLFRRSGIDFGSLGEELGKDFKSIPSLSRLDEYFIPNISRTRYALACANRAVAEGKAFCPDCNQSNWVEEVYGLRCDSCNSFWCDLPQKEHWGWQSHADFDG